MDLKPFNREKYQQMVNYLRENVGGVLSLYDPRPGEVAVNYKGEKVRLIRATEDLEELNIFIRRYVQGYNNYPELPIIELNEERTLLFIKPSYNDIVNPFKISEKRSKFYQHLNSLENEQNN
jgi:hypothetical protein